jgi:cytochrome bd-type quinol oxidase subunit 1
MTKHTQINFNTNVHASTFLMSIKKSMQLMCQARACAMGMFLIVSALVSLPAMAQTVSAQPTKVLSIVQVCKTMSRGGGCLLLFVPTQNQTTSAGNIYSSCAPGWLAYLSVEQGTVEQGGVNRGEAVVCGYTDAASALKAVVKACNDQNLGMCSRASQIDAKWAFWSEKSAVLASLQLDQPVDLRSFEQYQTCQSSVPVSASSTCLNPAADAARLAGFK